jgi:hypothetical protein
MSLRQCIQRLTGERTTVPTYQPEREPHAGS